MDKKYLAVVVTIAFSVIVAAVVPFLLVTVVTLVALVAPRL